jgi:2,4-dienoyl-CoA reductase-like NADH-dependent reductase (Old Yellow Enzyme family)
MGSEYLLTVMLLFKFNRVIAEERGLRQSEGVTIHKGHLAMTTNLFTPLKLRSVEFKNRIFVSPMCQYSSQDGMPQPWHLVHLGSRAVGGAACVIQEATAVSPEGRISPADAGIWNDTQMEAYRPIARFIREQGAVPAIQIAHAGRKASVSAPWDGNKGLDQAHRGWPVVAPSEMAFDIDYIKPSALTENEIKNVIQSFVKAAERSLDAGYEVIEIHAAHGYLLHEFMSPLSNQRTDDYGGNLENRIRMTLEVAAAVRKVWPERLPVFIRISASDWVEGGWDIAQSIELCKKLKAIGIDLIDVSSGGLVPHAKVPTKPGYQVPFAEVIRKDTGGMPIGAVGMITKAAQAEEIITQGQADVVLLARELLRDPYWPLHAAHELGADVAWPKQYDRAKPHKVR